MGAAAAIGGSIGVQVIAGTAMALAAGALGWRAMAGAWRSWVRWWLVWVPVVCVAAVATVRLTTAPAAWAFGWFAAAALVLAAVDVVLLRLPNVLVYPTVVVLGVWLPTVAWAAQRADVALRVLACALASGVGYLCLHLISPHGLGMGDVKFAPAVGMVMGWHAWGWALIAVLAAFVLAAAWGALLWLRSRRRHLPFGPCMVLGAAITPVVADPLVRWWWQV